MNRTAWTLSLKLLTTFLWTDTREEEVFKTHDTCGRKPILQNSLKSTWTILLRLLSHTDWKFVMTSRERPIASPSSIIKYHSRTSLIISFWLVLLSDTNTICISKASIPKLPRFRVPISTWFGTHTYIIRWTTSKWRQKCLGQLWSLEAKSQIVTRESFRMALRLALGQYGVSSMTNQEPCTEVTLLIPDLQGCRMSWTFCRQRL